MTLLAQTTEAVEAVVGGLAGLLRAGDLPPAEEAVVFDTLLEWCSQPGRERFVQIAGAQMGLWLGEACDEAIERRR